MSSPLPYLVRMLLFLAAVAVLAYFLHEDLIRIFLHTPVLDGVIFGVLVIGIFFVFRQVLILWPEVSWMRRYRHREAAAPAPATDSINLLAPLAAMMGDSHDQIRLSPTATRAVLDGIATRLDERREFVRYTIGLLIFLGLLGTFWGLLQTIGAVADAINSLQVTAGDAVQMFAKLKGSIEGPLTGMSTAFGASLFGLSGSLVLGFLELQASQAQGRFHIELEEWLAHATSLSTAGLPGLGQSVPAYVEALLERNTEGTDGLIRAVQRIEESRQAAAAGNATLVERLAALAETMRAQQNLLARFTELSIELRGAVARLSERSVSGDADRETSLTHQRTMEGLLSRLVEESLRNRGIVAEELAKRSDADRAMLGEHQRAVEARLADLGNQTAVHHGQLSGDLRAAVEQLADHSATEAARRAEVEGAERQRLATDVGTMMQMLKQRGAMGEAERQAAEMHRRAVEERLERLGEEDARRRSQMTEDLDRALARLGDRSGAEADREAIANLQRTVEGQLARLVEENVRNRTTLAEEMRVAVGQLADRFAEADRDAMALHRRTIEAHLARLVEDTGTNRIALAEEIRGEIRLLARTIALSRAPAPAPAPEPPSN